MTTIEYIELVALRTRDRLRRENQHAAQIAFAVFAEELNTLIGDLRRRNEEFEKNLPTSGPKS